MSNNRFPDPQATDIAIVGMAGARNVDEFSRNLRKDVLGADGVGVHDDFVDICTRRSLYGSSRRSTATSAPRAAMPRA